MQSKARTDLALESTEGTTKSEGIRVSERGRAFRVTEIAVESDKAGAAIGRSKGHYLTLEYARAHADASMLRAQAEELSAELCRFIPCGSVLVAGLGNADITPDALGPQTAGQILATRHLRRELRTQEPDTAFLRSLRPVSVLANGVLGQTGIETAELIAALRETIQPACIIAVDALACASVTRLGCTVQISDTGISPGSGVQNARAELSERTLGIPVIALGVPTVIDLHTAVRQSGGETDLPDMMVTPRDIDRLLHHAARLLSLSINLALHPQLSYEDAEAI